MSFIEFKQVKKHYRNGEVDICALEDISFSIEKGELVVIAGASGAGKSTILNILGGMDNVTSGSVIVDQQDISNKSDFELTKYRRYDIGFVFQFYNLVGNLTAKENVELACQLSKDSLDIDDVLQRVQLSMRKAHFPSQLSGGEQQRVAIARALAKNPKLLLCDEPTGALDYQTGKAILKLLQETCRKYNMTVVIITHNLALCPIADKIIKVKSGRIESVVKNNEPISIDDIEW